MKKMTLMMSVAIAILMVCMSSCKSSETPKPTEEDPAISGPKKSVEAFLEAEKKEDVEALRTMIVFSSTWPEEKKERFMYAYTQNRIYESNKRGGMQSYEVKDVELSKDSLFSKVRYSITYGNSTKEDVLYLQKVHDVWLVDLGLEY